MEDPDHIIFREIPCRIRFLTSQFTVESLKTTLKAHIHADTWATLNSTAGRNNWYASPLLIRLLLYWSDGWGFLVWTSMENHEI